MYAVEIDQLTYTYPGASQPTLREITLRIPQGDFLAVVGNNGCGKSTLCKTLNGLIPHFITGDFAGRVKVGGLDTLESDVSLLAQKVGYVYQDFENQIVRPTVLDDASYARMVAEHYAAKGYGPRKIRDELYRRGVPRDCWEEALSGVQDPENEIDRFIRRKMRGEDPRDPRALKRTSDALARRGYRWEEIKEGLERYGAEGED